MSLEVIVSNYRKIVLDLMYVNTFSLVESLMCGTVLQDNVRVCYKLFKDFNDKLKNSKYLECFLKGRTLLVCSCLLVLSSCITCIANKLN